MGFLQPHSVFGKQQFVNFVQSFPEHLYTLLFPRDVAVHAFLPESLILSSAHHLQVFMVSALVHAAVKKSKGFIVLQRLRPKLIKYKRCSELSRIKPLGRLTIIIFWMILVKLSCKPFKMFYISCFKKQNQTKTKNPNPPFSYCLRNLCNCCKRTTYEIHLHHTENKIVSITRRVMIYPSILKILKQTAGAVWSNKIISYWKTLSAYSSGSNGKKAKKLNLHS